jgi:hypothetical protein
MDMKRPPRREASDETSDGDAVLDALRARPQVAIGALIGGVTAARLWEGMDIASDEITGAVLNQLVDKAARPAYRRRQPIG